MSLIISVYVPTGLVLSGDSRTTGTRLEQVQDPQSPDKQIQVKTNVVLSDSAAKIFLIQKKFGIGSFGDAIINNLPIAHYIQQFVSEIDGEDELTTDSLAERLVDYFRKLNPIPNTHFIVVGYDEADPWVVLCGVNNNSKDRVNIDKESGEINFGIIRGGDTAVVNRLLSDTSFNPSFNFMNLQDAVDYSRHLIRSTIDQLKFEPRFPTVGGAIDTLIITTEGGKFLERKELKAG